VNQSAIRRDGEDKKSPNWEEGPEGGRPQDIEGAAGERKEGENSKHLATKINSAWVAGSSAFWAWTGTCIEIPGRLEEKAIPGIYMNAARGMGKKYPFGGEA